MRVASYCFSLFYQVDSERFCSFSALTKLDFSACSFNPKLTKIKEILLDVLGGDENARGIIFVKTRQLAGYMIKWMKETDELKGLNPTEFVGQTASVQVGGILSWCLNLFVLNFIVYMHIYEKCFPDFSK